MQLDEAAWLEAGGNHDEISSSSHEVGQGSAELDNSLDCAEGTSEGFQYGMIYYFFLCVNYNTLRLFVNT